MLKSINAIFLSLKSFTTVFIFFLLSNAFSQLNLDSVSHIDYQALHSANLNDIWAYVDEFGNEYAIVGTTKGTSVVDLSDPNNPSEIFWLPGSESVWRDPKVYGDYAYITTEAEDGLAIIDLTPLPSSNVLPTAVYTGPSNGQWLSAHNCFADENGILYIFGANRGNGGAIMLDVTATPMNPVEIGEFDDWYVHDGYARNDTLYLAHISDGFLTIVDIADKANPILLGSQNTPNTFTHNIWLSDDGNTVFTTDELSGSYIASYDITDPSNITKLDQIQSSPGLGVIPHNTFVFNDYLVTSYYSDGITIHDATYPYNLIEVGYYDTYPQQTTSYDGCWGAYPYLPSGLVLATDMEEGLFVLNPTYEKASYLEGVVTDQITSLAIDNVSVQISGNNQIDYSNSLGFYATGMLNTGSVDVDFSKVGYFPKTETVSISQGVITNLSTQLTPIPPYNLLVKVIDQSTGNPIDNAQIKLEHALITHTGSTNAVGEENFTLYYQDTYDINIGIWGYDYACMTQIIDQNTSVLTIQLSPGYHDNFEFDLGWSVSGSASKGMWERGVPNGSNGVAAPDDDSNSDCGSSAFVTGNAETFDADNDDVDDGNTILISPQMDLSTYTNPEINFDWGFFNFWGPGLVDDTMIVFLSNGTQMVKIFQVGSLGNVPFEWSGFNYLAAQAGISINSTMQIVVKTSDINPDVNITEAGFDNFRITEGMNVNSINSHNINVFPNPTNGIVNINKTNVRSRIQLLDVQGKILNQFDSQNINESIDLTLYEGNIFILKVDEHTYRVIKD